MDYRIGIDVGTRSTGFCALAVAEDGTPIEILNSVVYVHDSGLDPSGNEHAITRKAASGAARRARRRYRRRRQRLAALDSFLTEHGFPLVDLESVPDPRYPWAVRAMLLRERIDDDHQRLAAISVMARHIARHRGWRNPYGNVESLLRTSEPSKELLSFQKRISNVIGTPLPESSAPSEVVVAALRHDPHVKLRGPSGAFSGKLMQSDNATEMIRACDTQSLPHETRDELIRLCFAARSPRGSALKNVGHDPLPGQKHFIRAERSSPYFQRFRIVATLSNLRIREDRVTRSLTVEELGLLTDFLWTFPHDAEPTWEDVAEHLGVSRSALVGVGRCGIEGEPPATMPPTDSTTRCIVQSKVQPLIKWWRTATISQRMTLVDGLSNVGGEYIDATDAEMVDEFLCSLDAQILEKLDTHLRLPAGRASYSNDSLERLTEHILATGSSLHDARKAVFGVDDSWQPPAEAIGAPTGNPAVDRVLKQVARWLEGVEGRWGAPQSINIEHVRSAFGSESMAREYERAVQRRRDANARLDAQLHRMGLSGPIRNSDRIRLQLLQRQNCECLYCGSAVTFESSEVDHIVPRSGPASTNQRENLAVACRSCNARKSNLPFPVWAEREQDPRISLTKVRERVAFFNNPENSMTAAQFRAHKKALLQRVAAQHPDEEFDGRSMESVAWMATELRHRIEHHERSRGHRTSVNVYRGALTAEARKASGAESRVNLLGERGKTRFDRRHHAFDALTIALMTPGIGQVLSLRSNMRDAERLTGARETWRERTTFHGAPGEERAWSTWCDHMLRGVELFNIELTHNTIPTLRNLRLRLGNGAAHEVKIRPLVQKRVGESFTVTEIDRAATPALWSALRALPDFDPKSGLPEDPDRKIRLHDKWLNASETIGLFPSPAPAVAIRGGHAALGSKSHHFRIYRVTDGKRPKFYCMRVFTVDLLRHRNDDLFNVEIAENSMSRRCAPPKLREALRTGHAEYIGWFVAGDEFKIPATSLRALNKPTLTELIDRYPVATSWITGGVANDQRIRLHPALLAKEGLPDEEKELFAEFFGDNSCLRVTFAKLMDLDGVRIIRRDALGNERHSSSAHLPICLEPGVSP